MAPACRTQVLKCQFKFLYQIKCQSSSPESTEFALPLLNQLFLTHHLKVAIQFELQCSSLRDKKMHFGYLAYFTFGGKEEISSLSSAFTLSGTLPADCTSLGRRMKSQGNQVDDLSNKQEFCPVTPIDTLCP